MTDATATQVNIHPLLVTVAGDIHRCPAIRREKFK
jgi:hypothetical protein